MKSFLILLLFVAGTVLSCQSQTNNSTKPKLKNLSGMATAASSFLETLSATQKEETVFTFDNNERYNWHYIPKERKGITFNQMNDKQHKAALALLRSALSETAYNKANSIIQLENVLREVENRPANDTYRDPGNYHFSFFGDPATDLIWGWRLEGHHISLNFSSENNKIVSGTPGFLGSNPAIVLSGPEKGKHILKDETDMGLAFVKSLNAEQLKKAIISERAPGDIVTANNRKAMINDPKGIPYNELDSKQQKMFMELLSIYIQRYTKLFADDMMKDIEKAGFNNLLFAWAGEQQTGVGHPHYYRIHGPTILVEYDNTQNNSNHIHSVVRDLKYDFGGDELLEHYKNDHK